MFIYDQTGQVAINVNRIRALYIDKVEHGEAHTK